MGFVKKRVNWVGTQYQFEYCVAVSQGLMGSKQVIEIFAYGTAVRLH